MKKGSYRHIFHPNNQNFFPINSHPGSKNGIILIAIKVNCNLIMIFTEYEIRLTFHYLLFICPIDTGLELHLAEQF